MGSPAYVALWLDRFVSATADWTEEEVGAYLRLLIYQAQHGAVPIDPAKRARIVRMPRERFEELWTSLLAEKFQESPEGLQNDRMARERDLAIAHSERQSTRAKARWARRKKAEYSEENSPVDAASSCRGGATASAGASSGAEPRDMPGLSHGYATQTQTQTQKTIPPPPPLGGCGASGEDEDRERLLEAFGDIYLERTGRPYQATKAEERAARELLALSVGQGGLQDVLARARRLLASADAWERENASLRTLVARWSKFATAPSGGVDPKPWGQLRPETWLAQAADRYRKALEAGDDLQARRARREVEERARIAGLPEPTLPSRELTPEERERMARFFPRIASEA
jgi:uncharacterized protein YdaU (DUF1376 family)